MKKLIFILVVASLAACGQKNADKEAQLDAISKPDPNPIPSAYAQGTVKNPTVNPTPDQSQKKSTK